MINEIIERLCMEIRRSDGDLWTFDVEDVSKVLAEIERLQSEVTYWRMERNHERRQADLYIEKYKRERAEVVKLEDFLQEIDTHLRSTPDALPHVFGTIRKYWNYREAE
ncbi:hypothetical protein [Siminovitchia sp. 179-K 8D1 HS]|uniref:hypothetical protein n=1 Tax=Siminovitchia sp. 179-K 8D1 HS TaxID=3142385 RepID=UPI00399F4D14